MGEIFVHLLCHLRSNEWAPRDAFRFAKIICQKDVCLYFGSLNVDSLLIKVLLDETINTCDNNKLCKDNKSIPGLNKKQIIELISLISKEPIILFDVIFYTQVDGAAIGSH